MNRERWARLATLGAGQSAGSPHNPVTSNRNCDVPQDTFEYVTHTILYQTLIEENRTRTIDIFAEEDVTAVSATPSLYVLMTRDVFRSNCHIQFRFDRLNWHYRSTTKIDKNT